MSTNDYNIKDSAYIVAFIAAPVGYYLGDIGGAISAYFLLFGIIKYRNATTDDTLNFYNSQLALLKICSKLIGSDGVIDELEVEFVRKNFKKALGNDLSELLFRDLKTSKISNDIHELCKIIKKVNTNLYEIIIFLYTISIIDGTISKEEDVLIKKVGINFGLPISRIENARRSVSDKFKGYTNSERQDYSSENNQDDSKRKKYLEILELKENATDQEIKKAYRTLAKEYHPDVINNLNDRMKKLAQDKFREIQEAYEYLKKK